jgi:hypothetical protein
VDRQVTARYEKQPDHLWRAQIEEDPEIHIAARSLKAARSGIRDTLAGHLGGVAVELNDSFVLLPASSDAVQRAWKARARAEEAAADAMRSAAIASRALVEDGLSLRDAAEILGLSHTRVQQLLRELEQSETGP